MSDEDDMVSALIEHEKQTATEDMDLEIEPEAHYNYYGDRGVADLFVRRGEKDSNNRMSYSETVYEIKSDIAIEDATGANEIIRQFNRMRQYFFRDENRRTKANHSRNHPRIHFKLIFIASELALEHVYRNAELYRSIEPGREYTNGKTADTMVAFSHPDQIGMMPISLGGLNILSEDWKEVAENHNPVAYRNFGDSTELS